MKYSKSKIFKAVAVVVLLVTVFLSLSKFHDTRCNVVSITIKDSADVKFVDVNDVRTILNSVMGEIEGHTMDSINTFLFDEQLRKCPYIRNVSIYKSITGILNIDIQQRKPILLVLNDKQDYYIDSDGMIFAASDKDACQCIVVNGHVKDKYDFTGDKIYKADPYAEGSQSGELFKLAQLIQDDDYWSDQVVQIFINQLGEYEIVPMVGNFVLSIGSIEDYDKKMYTLKQFFFKALPKLGWNTYQQISVKYNNQIVCKRRKEIKNNKI
jgi:cell division protein FtsQ